MSRMKKTNRMEKFAAGGSIPTPDPHFAAYNRALVEQMRAASQAVSWVYQPSTFITGPGSATRESAFAASEFTMGTAVGVRSWNVDRLGRLESPSYKTVWSPDEMTAECKRDTYDFLPPRREAGAPHEQSSCNCGFYAYYEGFNDYAEPSRVTGVIEGYGETQIGTRGFKSAKARIVALYVPDDTADTKRIGQTPFGRVRENYGPHVAIFDDYTQMSAEFPTTQPEDAPTPDTDPDFWTRGI